MAIKCGHCGDRHSSVAAVRVCSMPPSVTREGRVDLDIRRRGSAFLIPFAAAEKETQRRKRLANPTPPEQRLRAELSRGKLDGFSFTRGQLVRGWVADFYCEAAQLIVEVDGAHHDRQRNDDRHRDDILRAEGYRILRFAAARVLTDVRGVFQEIRSALDNLEARIQRDFLKEVRRTAPDASSLPPRDPSPALEAEIPQVRGASMLRSKRSRSRQNSRGVTPGDRETYGGGTGFYGMPREMKPERAAGVCQACGFQ